jgi:hypothetical protein
MTCVGDLPQALFASMMEPSVQQVGHIVNLNSGHTNRFNENETAVVALHLKAAGFTSPLVHQ